MNARDQPSGEHDYLRRLSPEAYRGRAYVHWSMTIDGRKKGWLIPILYYKFREVLTHAAFRYSFCCPIYCLMPDHMHLLWVGFNEASDQLRGARFFRTHMNPVLKKLGAEFQLQPHDHVLRDDERQADAFENVVEYIARNPERAGLVAVDAYKTYPYTGCLLPGYPTLSLWQPDFWPLFWRIYAKLGGRIQNGEDGESET
jgi:REP element-mobilizing transposase RayT